MKTDIAVTAQERVRLEGLFGDRNTSAKIVWRAQIVLAGADPLFEEKVTDIFLSCAGRLKRAGRDRGAQQKFGRPPSSRQMPTRLCFEKRASARSGFAAFTFLAEAGLRNPACASSVVGPCLSSLSGRPGCRSA
jgi:hypothetical protein